VDVEHVVVKPVSTPASTKEPVAVDVVAITTKESYGVLQKGLFLAAILGCVAIYMRMNKKGKRFMGKSIV